MGRMGRKRELVRRLVADLRDQMLIAGRPTPTRQFCTLNQFQVESLLRWVEEIIEQGLRKAPRRGSSST